MTNLIAPVIWSVVVTLTLWPRLLGRRLGFATYVLTMTMNELPVVFLLITGVGIWTGFEGRPDGAVRVLWLALWAYVILGFVWVQVRARTARRALENALRAGLGESWRRESDLPMVRGRDTASRWLRGILLPFERRRAGVERVRDLAYGPEPAHRLDLYRSRSTADGPRPILIQFHEGGFVQGGKSREAVTLLNHLAAHGWLCLSADYRLREAATWPNPLIDAKRAIAWAREHAREHDADPRPGLPRRWLSGRAHGPQRRAHS